MEKNKKIVVIGAGPAGLTAAWELVKDTGHNYEVLVLEASDTVGGMAKTVRHNGNMMDIGGHRFYSKENRVLEWWKKILPEEETSALMLRERRTSIYYKNQFFEYPVTLNLGNMRKLGIRNSCLVGVDYIRAYISRQQEDSLENFYRNRFGKKLYSMFFEDYTKKLCGVHPKEISPKWGEERVRGLSMGAILKKGWSGKKRQTKDSMLSASQFYYPKYGPGQLWENVAEELVRKGVELRNNCPVVSVCREEAGRVHSVKVQTADGEEQIEGDIFISSMPIRELVAGMNLVPEKITELAEKLPYRAFVTMGLLVDRLAVEVPDCWIYVQDERVKVCRIQFYDNWSPYLSKERNGKVFLALEYFCETGDEFWTMTEEECCKFAVKEAVTLGIFDAKTQILDWHREQIAQAYPGYYGAYGELGKIKDYLAGIDNLFSIGRNGEHAYWNMDKCMLSAWETVKKIERL